MSTTNGHKEEPDQWLTVKEAASRLNTTEPRLRRLLSRPDFSSVVRQEERQTRTGTRTATVVSVSVLSDLLALLEKRNGHRPEGKQEHERSEALALISSAMDRVLREKDARIEALERELEKADAREKELFAALQREQTLRAMLPAPPEAPPDAPGDTQEGQTEPGGLTDSQVEMSPRGANPDRPARRWWQVWKRGRD